MCKITEKEKKLFLLREKISSFFVLLFFFNCRNFAVDHKKNKKIIFYLITLVKLS